MDWLRRLFLGDDRLFLGGQHLNSVLRANKFHNTPDIGEIRKFKLFLDYERHGYIKTYIDTEDLWADG